MLRILQQKTCTLIFNQFSNYFLRINSRQWNCWVKGIFRTFEIYCSRTFQRDYNCALPPAVCVNVLSLEPFQPDSFICFKIEKIT